MSEASGSASPAPSASVGDVDALGARPKRAIRPTAKALLAREQSPEGWEHGGSRRSQPARPIRTSSGARPQIKLKMKASGGGTAAVVGQGPKTQPYMQGYDRELDSEDDETGEGLAFEEQLIFRMPEGPECDKLRESIQKRQLGDDVWFKFKDSRRAVVHVGNSLFSAKLVDLPTITESHKTLDNRQFFKVGDISQMLVVEGKIADESQASSSGAKGFNIEDFVYPHGITPPMHWARKRRFRKRAARRAIETVEKEVERLLKADKKADDVEYEMIDAAEEGGSEDDEDDQRGPQARRAGASPGGSQAETPMPDGSDVGSQDEDGDEDDEEGGGGGQSHRRRAADGGMEEDEGEGIQDDEDPDDDDDDVDEDLAAELDAALEEEDDDDDAESTRGAGSEAQSRASDQEDLWDDDDDDDADDGGEDDEDEEDENDEEKEQRVREAQLEAECRELEMSVRKQQAEVDNTMNLIIKNRQLQKLRKLTTERDMKRNQLADLKQARKERREAHLAAVEAAQQAGAASSTHDTSDGTAQALSRSDASGQLSNEQEKGQQRKSQSHSSSIGPPASLGTEDVGISTSTSQNLGMPPPPLPANRLPPQSSATTSGHVASETDQPSEQDAQGEDDLWNDDENDDGDEEGHE